MLSSACATVTPSASLRDRISSVVKSPTYAADAIIAGAKREPSSLVQLAMQIGSSVSIPASLSVRTTSSAASVPSTPSNLPPVGCVSSCEPGGFARLAKPVAHLLVFGTKRQPPHAAFGRGAEFRGLVNRAPEAGGV